MPFSTALPDENPDGDATVVSFNWRLPGQYYDAESGLHYNYYRDYSPRRGRYAQSDPVGLLGGVNTYAYVGGNPVRSVDSLGLLEVGYGQNILNLPDGAAISNGAVSMDGPGSPLGAGETALNLAPEIKVPGAIVGALKAAKSINLPSVGKVSIDLQHVLSGHTAGGLRVSSSKTLFPKNMTPDQIEKAIMDAYKNCKTLKRQEPLVGDKRVLLRGTSRDGLSIEMWLNLDSRIIETAYPVP